MIASEDLGQLQLATSRAQQNGQSQFVATPFYQQIAGSYQQGVEWLFCADMEQIVQQNVQQGDGSRHDLPPGIGDVKYLMMGHRGLAGKSESHADLTFASERQGVASWLALQTPLWIARKSLQTMQSAFGRNRPLGCAANRLP